MAANDLQTAFVPQKWSKRVLTRLDQLNVALRCGAVNRDYEGDIKTEGDTVWVRTYGNVTMGRYTRESGINYNGLTPVKQSLQVNDAQYFAFSVDDLDTAQNDLNALDGYTDRAAVAMNEKVEEKCWAPYASAITANKLSNSGSPFTIDKTNAYSKLIAAQKALNKAKAPRAGRWAVIGPTYEAALLEDSTYVIRATDLGDKVVMMGMKAMAANSVPGFLGQCAGFNLFGTTSLPTDGGTGTYALFGAPGVISYAGQIRKLERIRLQDTFGDAVRGLILHDSKVFDEHAKALGYIYYTES